MVTVSMESGVKLPISRSITLAVVLQVYLTLLYSTGRWEGGTSIQATTSPKEEV